VRWSSHRPLLWGAVVLATGLSAVTGCSDGARTSTTGSSLARSSARPADIPTGPTSAPPSAVGLSPAGITTRIDVPADSTEEEYYQACHAAKLWMEAQPKTGASLVEPYLAMLQASPSGNAGSWNARWSDLTLARQAAVITAARAASDDECG
jgi:Putative lipoprotein LpqV